MRVYHKLLLSHGLAVMLGVVGVGLAEEAAPSAGTPNVSRMAMADQTKTLQNLETAHYGEINAHARYLAYASRADQDGYPGIATLFRTIGRGEQIHAANLAALIEKVHLLPAIEMEPMTVRTTRENLEDSVNEQKYERDVMYPEFVKQARAEKQKDAELVFKRNQAAEPRHVAWCQQALDDLADFKGNAAVFLVCPVCGNTVKPSEVADCQACSGSRSNFETIN